MIESKEQTLPPMVIRSNRLYDALKYIAQILLPAVGALYFALSQTWGFPHGAEVVGTVTSVDVFLGVLLHLSSQAYNNSDAKYDGSVDVTETAEKKSFMLNIPGDPQDLDQKDEILLKINPAEKPLLKKTVRKRTKSS